MRIESVHYDASGDATIVASGGIIFLLPRGRIREFAALVVERLSLSFVAEEQNAVRAVFDALLASAVDFEPEDGIIQCLWRIDKEWKAEKKGLELCARAEQSSQGLKAKLIARGFDSAVAAATIQRLIDEGAVDDARFATIWARTRAEGKCEGPTLVAAGLRARGLGQEAIREALSFVSFDALIPKAVEKESKRLARQRVKSICEKSDQGGQALREEVYRSLKAQGFNASLLREELGL